MFSLIIRNPLIVVMEADVLRRQKLETAHLIAVLCGQIDEISPILGLRVSIVDDDAISLLDLLLSHLVALLLGLERISVDPAIFRHVVLPEGGFA